MPKFNNEQILSVLQLGHNNPLIDYTDVSFHSSGSSYLSVVSGVDAGMVEVLDLLTGIFHSVTVEMEPFHAERPDGICADLYDIKVGEGKTIALHMLSTQKEKLPAPTESIENIAYADSLTSWTPAQVHRQEA
jgi:WD40 repeat protein